MVAILSRGRWVNTIIAAVFRENSVVNTVTADGVAPLGAWTSGGTMITNFGSITFTEPAPKELSHQDKATTGLVSMLSNAANTSGYR